MERRSVGSFAALAGAVLMFVAVLHPTWFSLRTKPEWDGDLTSISLRTKGDPYDDHGRVKLGESATGVRYVSYAAVPLCVALSIAGFRRRVPFLLSAIAGVAAGAFGLMTLIVKIDNSSIKFGPSWGFFLALLGGLLGVVGSGALASWSMSEESREKGPVDGA